MPDEKFPRSFPRSRADRDAAVENIEQLKQQLRVEEQFPEADVCPACKEVRARSGDPTDLCAEHLKRIYGV